MKRLRLHKSNLSNEAIAAIAATTLATGGFDPAPEQKKDPAIGEKMSNDAARGSDRGPHRRGMPCEESMRAAHASEPAIGAVMGDGTIFAGRSPDTNLPMYSTPADAPLTLTVDEASSYADRLAAHGHRDWRVPTKPELNLLFNNRAAIGGFNVNGSAPAYWSAEPYGLWRTWCQRFRDGLQFRNDKDDHSYVRCVR